MKKREAFTLIELVSVLVILAILALIVTPLVLNIIKKARTAADKRSIDAYGRSIELAVADYLLDTGNFPTSIEELTIEYSGDRVVCETAGLQPDDTSVYLANCKVNGRSVTGYTYGRVGAPIETYRAYNIGEEVTYNNVNYYVIANSDETESSVTLLKAEPLTTEEVNTYGGVGTANNHVNMYITTNTNSSYYQQAHDNNGYGGMAYYSSTSCGYDSNNEWQESGCITDYAQSEVKYVIDAWKTAQAPDASAARLISHEELVTNLGYENRIDTIGASSNGTTPDWVNSSSDYYYWTMSQFGDETYKLWMVLSWGICQSHVGNDLPTVRPVIEISKTANLIRNN